MTRKKIKQGDEAEVLLHSKRRCAICFGLKGNFKICKGQIAHIDQNNENSDLENLVFLCFLHHEEYDSITSQSKGIRPQELKFYRKKLYEFVKEWEKTFSPEMKPSKRNLENSRTNTSNMLLNELEVQILKLLSLGFSQMQTSERLPLSASALEKTINSLKNKFNAKNVSQLITNAISLGII